MTKTLSQRLLAIVLILTMLLPIAVLPASAEEITPYYNNVVSANSVVSISASGKMSITNTYQGMNGITTKGVITTKVEKRTLGLFWKDIDGGAWTDTINNYYYSGIHTLQLSDTGTYRVTVKFTIYGTNGAADSIEKKIEKKY